MHLTVYGHKHLPSCDSTSSRCSEQVRKGVLWFRLEVSGSLSASHAVCMRPSGCRREREPLAPDPVPALQSPPAAHVSPRAAHAPRKPARSPPGGTKGRGRSSQGRGRGLHTKLGAQTTATAPAPPARGRGGTRNPQSQGPALAADPRRLLIKTLRKGSAEAHTQETVWEAVTGAGVVGGKESSSPPDATGGPFPAEGRASLWVAGHSEPHLQTCKDRRHTPVTYFSEPWKVREHADLVPMWRQRAYSQDGDLVHGAKPPEGNPRVCG